MTRFIIVLILMMEGAEGLGGGRLGGLGRRWRLEGWKVGSLEGWKIGRLEG
jgi:hypothetical protein